MIDGHMHLEYGDLSKEYVLQFVESAVKNGMDEIQILDHTHRFKEFRPVYEGVRKASPYQEEWLNNKEMKFHSTLDEYCALIKEIKAMDLPIKVSFGLEVCYVPEYEETIRKILKPYHFDFLVGAIHSIDGKLYDMKWSEEILWNKYPVDKIYKRYYECVFSLVKSDLFTQLAHPDTIKMFGHYPTYDLQPTYDELAELLNEHHMKAENNVGCYYRYHTPDIGLSDQLLQTFKKHHVQMITASDAHHPEDVGRNIADVWEKTMK